MIKVKTLSEDLAGVDFTLQNSVQQDFLVVSSDVSNPATPADILPEELVGFRFLLRNPYPADNRASTGNLTSLIDRAACPNAFQNSISVVAVSQFQNLLYRVFTTFTDDVSCTEFLAQGCPVFVVAEQNDLFSTA